MDAERAGVGSASSAARSERERKDAIFKGRRDLG
jgi:hypothetical protein